MRSDNCIAYFLHRAQADEPVYITDVRETFDREGCKAFHVHALLYEGDTESYRLRLPQWEDDRQKEFVAEYIRAFLYNLLSTLGALRIEIYLDRSDLALTALAEGLSDDFQVNRTFTERTGYGKCLNVNERIIRALKGDSEQFSIAVKDLAQEADVHVKERQGAAAPVFAELPERAAERFLLGIDVGGTDVKFAVSLNGMLLHCEEFNWAPASISCVEDLMAPILDTAERLRNRLGEGRKWDGIGLSWPDVIIHNRIVGGETTKTKGLRENKDRDYETQLIELASLCERLSEHANGENAVQCCNDGPMAAFTDAVEMAAAGQDVSRGFMAYSLGTELGTGWVQADGSIPQIPLEVYNCIIDLGSYKARNYRPDDVRSILNVNTHLPGTLQKYTGQSGVFRLAYRDLPVEEPEILREAEEKGLLRHEGGRDLVVVPTEPEDRRKECLEFFMEQAASGKSAVCREIFRKIGEYIAVTWAENEYLLHPEAKDRTLFGRLVKRGECYDLIREGAARREPSLVLHNADASLAVTPLMRQLEENPVFTVAQFAQAVGALHYGCLGKK